MEYHVYILRCANGAYYVGYTENLEQRVLRHNQGRAAAYTKQNGPVELLYSEAHSAEKEAMSRERQLKKWTRVKKEALIRGDLERLHEEARRKSFLKSL